MAKKPMRTATGRGQDRAVTARALLNVSDKAANSGGKFGEPLRKALDATTKAVTLMKEERRIQKAGARMGRAMAAAKAKQKSK